jgi:hypothetical protein
MKREGLRRMRFGLILPSAWSDWEKNIEMLLTVGGPRYEPTIFWKTKQECHPQKVDPGMQNKSFKILYCKRWTYPVTDSKAQRGDRGIALHYLDLGARRGWVVSITPRPLYPRERPRTHCTGGWVSPRTGLYVCEKSRPYRDSIPGPFSP